MRQTHHGWVAGILTLLLLASTAGSAAAVQPAGESSGTATESARLADRPVADVAQTTDNITLTQRYELTPDQPGSVRLTLDYDIPDRVRSLRAYLVDDASVVSRDGFNRVNGSVYEWDESTSTPSITLQYDPNQTTTKTGPEAAEGRYLFADAGEWALLKQFRTAHELSYLQTGGGPVGVERRLRTSGPGAAGNQLVFLGDVTTTERTANGQQFRLVVPETAELSASPETILDSLTNASASLRVGDRDENVMAIAAPTGRVEWGVRGLAYGGSGFWVRDFERLDEPDNVWLHEYVHTRQAFSGATTAETRWLTEGSAQYYAALLTLEQERIAFDEFRAELAVGERPTYDDVVLAEPSTWTRNANYRKGALAAGRLDESLRAATNKTATLEGVIRRLNRRGGSVTQTAFLDAVAATGGSETRARAAEITATSEPLSMWDQRTQSRLFGTLPAQVSYALPNASDGYRASGPYRNGPVSATPVRLATDETLTLDAVVRNTGDEAGAYNATVTVNGRVVTSTDGEIAAESERTVALSHTFEQAGEYTLGVGEETVSVVVEPPASPTVVGVSADRQRARPGDSAVVTATVRNDAAIPANGTVEFTRDGETVVRRAVTLAPGNSTQLSTTIPLPTAGETRLGAGGADPVTVSVVAPAATTSADGATNADGDPAGSGATSGGDGPGFTAPVAVLAVLVALLVRRRQ